MLQKRRKKYIINKKICMEKDNKNENERNEKNS